MIGSTHITDCAIWWSVVRPVLPDLYAELRDLETAYQKQAKQPIQTRLISTYK